MTAELFAYWLQGFAELNQNPPTAAQWQSIREHLATVFTKVTPPCPVVIKEGEGDEMQPISPMPRIDVSKWGIAVAQPAQPLRSECSTIC